MKAPNVIKTPEAEEIQNKVSECFGVYFTVREAVILARLFTQCGKTVSSNHLLQKGGGKLKPQTLRAHIKNIRRKLAGNGGNYSLKCERTVGYRLVKTGKKGALTEGPSTSGTAG